MNKLLLSLALSSVLFGGFVSNPAEMNLIQSVSKVKNLYDDSYVTLEGSIVKQVSNDEYLFRDNTGQILIEVDEDKWRGLEVSSKDIVHIEGELDRELIRTKIEVKRIYKVK